MSRVTQLGSARPTGGAKGRGKPTLGPAVVLLLAVSRLGPAVPEGPQTTSTRLALLTFKDLSEPLVLEFKTPCQVAATGDSWAIFR